MHGDQLLTGPRQTKTDHTDVGLSKTMDTVTVDIAAQEDPGRDVTKDSKSGIDMSVKAWIHPSSI